MTGRLKPCPFCGSEAILRVESDYDCEGNNRYYHVECDCCLFEMPKVGDVKIAIEAWNRRDYHE